MKALQLLVTIKALQYKEKHMKLVISKNNEGENVLEQCAECFYEEIIDILKDLNVKNLKQNGW